MALEPTLILSWSVGALTSGFLLNFLHILIARPGGTDLEDIDLMSAKTTSPSTREERITFVQFDLTLSRFLDDIYSLCENRDGSDRLSPDSSPKLWV